MTGSGQIEISLQSNFLQWSLPRMHENFSRAVKAIQNASSAAVGVAKISPDIFLGRRWLHWEIVDGGIVCLRELWLDENLINSAVCIHLRGDVLSVHFESCQRVGTMEEDRNDLTVSGHFLLRNGGVHTIKLYSPTESTSVLDFLVVAGEGDIIDMDSTNAAWLSSTVTAGHPTKWSTYATMSTFPAGSAMICADWISRCSVVVGLSTGDIIIVHISDQGSLEEVPLCDRSAGLQSLVSDLFEAGRRSFIPSVHTSRNIDANSVLSIALCKDVGRHTNQCSRESSTNTYALYKDLTLKCWNVSTSKCSSSCSLHELYPPLTAYSDNISETLIRAITFETPAIGDGARRDMTSPESPEIRNTISLIAVAVCVQYGLHDTQEELNSSFWHLHTDSKESSSGNVWQILLISCNAHRVATHSELGESSWHLVAPPITRQAAQGSVPPSLVDMQLTLSSNPEACCELQTMWHDSWQDESSTARGSSVSSFGVTRVPQTMLLSPSSGHAAAAATDLSLVIQLACDENISSHSPKRLLYGDIHAMDHLQHELNEVLLTPSRNNDKLSTGSAAIEAKIKTIWLRRILLVRRFSQRDIATAINVLLLSAARDGAALFNGAAPTCSSQGDAVGRFGQRNTELQLKTATATDDFKQLAQLVLDTSEYLALVKYNRMLMYRREDNSRGAEYLRAGGTVIDEYVVLLKDSFIEILEECKVVQSVRNCYNRKIQNQCPVMCRGGGGGDGGGAGAAAGAAAGEYSYYFDYIVAARGGDAKLLLINNEGSEFLVGDQQDSACLQTVVAGTDLSTAEATSLHLINVVSKYCSSESLDELDIGLYEVFLNGSFETSADLVSQLLSPIVKDVELAVRDCSSILGPVLCRAKGYIAVTQAATDTVIPLLESLLQVAKKFSFPTASSAPKSCKSFSNIVGAGTVGDMHIQFCYKVYLVSMKKQLKTIKLVALLFNYLVSTSSHTFGSVDEDLKVLISEYYVPKANLELLQSYYFMWCDTVRPVDSSDLTNAISISSLFPGSDIFSNCHSTPTDRRHSQKDPIEDFSMNSSRSVLANFLLQGETHYARQSSENKMERGDYLGSLLSFRAVGPFVSYLVRQGQYVCLEAYASLLELILALEGCQQRKVAEVYAAVTDRLQSQNSLFSFAPDCVSSLTKLRVSSLCKTASYYEAVRKVLSPQYRACNANDTTASGKADVAVAEVKDNHKAEAIALTVRNLGKKMCTLLYDTEERCILFGSTDEMRNSIIKFMDSLGNTPCSATVAAINTRELIELPAWSSFFASLSCELRKSTSDSLSSDLSIIIEKLLLDGLVLLENGLEKQLQHNSAFKSYFSFLVYQTSLQQEEEPCSLNKRLVLALNAVCSNLTLLKIFFHIGRGLEIIEILERSKAVLPANIGNSIGIHACSLAAEHIEAFSMNIKEIAKDRDDNRVVDLLEGPLQRMLMAIRMKRFEFLLCNGYCCYDECMDVILKLRETVSRNDPNQSGCIGAMRGRPYSCYQFGAGQIRHDQSQYADWRDCLRSLVKHACDYGHLNWLCCVNCSALVDISIIDAIAEELGTAATSLDVVDIIRRQQQLSSMASAHCDSRDVNMLLRTYRCDYYECWIAFLLANGRFRDASSVAFTFADRVQSCFPWGNPVVGTASLTLAAVECIYRYLSSSAACVDVLPRHENYIVILGASSVGEQNRNLGRNGFSKSLRFVGREQLAQFVAVAASNVDLLLLSSGASHQSLVHSMIVAFDNVRILCESLSKNGLHHRAMSLLKAGIELSRRAFEYIVHSEFKIYLSSDEKKIVLQASVADAARLYYRDCHRCSVEDLRCTPFARQYLTVKATLQSKRCHAMPPVRAHKNWRKLLDTLVFFDGPVWNWCLHESVFENIIVHGDLQLFDDLAYSYKLGGAAKNVRNSVVGACGDNTTGGDIYVQVRTLIKSGRLLEACNFATDTLCRSNYISYHCLDELINKCNESMKKSYQPSLINGLNKLTAKLEEHFQDQFAKNI